ncbi:movement protein [Digitaria didactyla striate mosaic virus]|uniref:Movement protein n=1 Tax=Digitaria didactyla striate mosaic virus TaxID=889510 RepID=E2FER1_9GEMI|nr:movement protein [Digitaria didactyla striate mosaic virus]ADN93257.1 movement protein [Digitaria didactyla striate mosaic virus]
MATPTFDSAYFRSGSVVQNQDGTSFAFPVKVTALVCISSIVAAAILVFLYKTCLQDCITQWRLTTYGSHFSSGFGGTHLVTSGQPESNHTPIVSLPDRSAVSVPPVSLPVGLQTS